MDELNKERFKLIAQTEAYQKKLRQTVFVMQEMLRKCSNPALNFSFGKDSLVCLDIARRLKPDILVINIDPGKGGHLQEAVDLYDAYAKKHNLNYHRVNTSKTIFEAYQEAGSLFKIGRNADLLKEAGEKAKETFQFDCRIMGHRTEESHDRRFLRRLGMLHYSEREKIWICNPVLFWTGAQIWAYIVDNNVSYIPWYDKEAEFVGYERARYSNWAGLYMSQMGRFVRLKKFYPDEYNELAALFPEIRHDM